MLSRLDTTGKLARTIRFVPPPHPSLSPKGERVWKFGLALFAAFIIHTATAADLPKSTQAMLRSLKIDPGIMRGIEEELTVPPDWLEGAKREGTVKILGSWDTQQFATMV